MQIPIPTPIYRIVHIDNLHSCLERGGLYAPNHTPNDGVQYKTIHDPEIQNERQARQIPCGTGGVIHEYVPFYFGYLSPMLLRLKTGKVEGYDEGQEPLIYLVSTVQTVQTNATSFVFSDGHGIAAYTDWYTDPADLDKVDWSMVYQRYWSTNTGDMDRQRRKQAEFLVHKCCSWQLILSIATVNNQVKSDVETIMNQLPTPLHRPVQVKPEWYY